MKTIVAGCGDFRDYDLLKKRMDEFRKDHEVTQIVSGGASGVDYYGEKYAQENDIPIQYFPADWIKHGKAAGPIRNREMAEYGDQLFVVWDGKSKGTKNMIDEMNKRKKPVFMVWIGGPIEAQNAN